MSEKKFGTVVTNEGAALIAECILTGKALPIVEAAAGDGGGAYYEPTADQTALKGERWRGEIAGFVLSEYSPNMIDVKIIIDDEVGGFTVREMGLFTDDGVLFAICNTPDTEKVSITGGIPGRLTMTMHIIVADASAVEVVVNPDLDSVTPEQLSKVVEQINSTLGEQAARILAAKTAAEEAKTAAETASTVPIDFSVPASAWTASDDPAFPFAAEIVDETVTADHIAHFVFDKASILAAMEAVIITGDTSDGKITLLAKEAPTVELSGAYKITQRKGAAE